MKKLLVLTVLTTVLTACSTSGEDLQGRFGTSTKEWTMELSSNSPSGDREVSREDDVLVFDMTLPAKNILETGSMFEVYFKTDGDLDPIADGVAVNLVMDGRTIGKGEFTLVDPSVPSEGTALITTTEEVKLKAGTPKSFTISTDSSAILIEDSKEDDVLTVGVEYNGKSLTGNTLNY